MLPGKFITLEGGEGVGKTTNLASIHDYLSAQNIDVVMTREPGGTVVSEKIRDLLLDPHHQAPIAQDTELLLMFAARAQHITEKIKPALAKGQWVVCSRFTDSSFAYQGGGRGISLQRIQQLADWVHGDFQPDLTILLDLPVELGLERARQRASFDRIEQEKSAFFNRVRQAYLDRAKTSQRYHVIDADQALPAIVEQVRCLISGLV